MVGGGLKPDTGPPACIAANLQVRWARWRSCWVTAADDDMIRVWSQEGVKINAYTYSGGSCQALYADNVNQLMVATMLVRAQRLGFGLGLAWWLGRVAPSGGHRW